MTRPALLAALALALAACGSSPSEPAGVTLATEWGEVKVLGDEHLEQHARDGSLHMTHAPRPLLLAAAACLFASLACDASPSEPAVIP